MSSAGLVQDIRHAYDGEPWHGSPITKLLDGIDAGQAGARPIADGHTIGELVLHLTAWTREVRRRLLGGSAAEPVDGDWPAVAGTGNEAWATARAELGAAHAELAETVRRMEPDDAAQALVRGLLQHDAYHAGQIALLRKLVTAHASAP